MEVILLQNWGKLGNFGETVKVKPGFARNFLIPREKALCATAGNRKKFEQQREALRRNQADHLEQLRIRAEASQNLQTLVIPVRVGVEGKLFGSVTLKEVVTHLHQKGIMVERSELRLSSRCLRHLGQHTLVFAPHPQVHATTTILLVDETSSDWEKKASNADLA